MNLDKELTEMSDVLRSFPRQQISYSAAERLEKVLEQKKAGYIRRKKLLLTYRHIRFAGIIALLSCLLLLFLGPENQIKDRLITWAENVSAALLGDSNQPDTKGPHLPPEDQGQDRESNSILDSDSDQLRDESLEWKSSPTFQFDTLELVGVEGDYGLTNTVFFRDIPVNAQWYLFNKNKGDLTLPLHVVATNAKTGMEIILVGKGGYASREHDEEGTVYYVNSELTFPESGVWKLELSANESIGTIIVEVLEGFDSDSTDEQMGFNDQFQYATYNVIGREGYYGLRERNYTSERGESFLLFIIDPTDQYIDSTVSITAVDPDRGTMVPILHGEELAPLKFEDAYSIFIDKVTIPYKGEWYIQLYIDHEPMGAISVDIQPSKKEKLIDEFVQGFDLNFDHFNRISHSSIQSYTDFDLNMFDHIVFDGVFIPSETTSSTGAIVYDGVFLISDDEERMYVLTKLYDGTNVYHDLIRTDHETKKVFIVQNSGEQKGKSPIEY